MITVLRLGENWPIKALFGITTTTSTPQTGHQDSLDMYIKCSRSLEFQCFTRLWRFHSSIIALNNLKRVCKTRWNCWSRNGEETFMAFATNANVSLYSVKVVLTCRNQLDRRPHVEWRLFPAALHIKCQNYTGGSTEGCLVIKTSELKQESGGVKISCWSSWILW